MTVAALGAALLAAGCTTNADRRAEQYAEAGGQMEYNIGVVKAEQERIQAEEYYAEQARQKAKAQKQAAKAKADKGQIPLRFVFVYSFRLYDQNYTTIPSSFSELIGYLSKIICYGDIF